MKNEKILLLEDSSLLASTLKREIEHRAVYEVHIAQNFGQAKQMLQQQQGYTLALLDLTLPDATQEEIVTFFRKAAIPSVVMTNHFDEAQREYVFSQGVIDFILKDGPTSLEYLFALLDRLHRNRRVKILLVDDSRASRDYMKRVLEKHNFQVLDTASGLEALDTLASDGEISLVVADYHMPGMDGYELTQRIRQQWSKARLGILGISSHGANVLSARFLKVGANDFLSKPFLEEEFTCRITLNVENLERIQALEQTAIRDFLTGLYNRRYLWETGAQLFAKRRDGKQRLCAAILDVDFFKKVNDTYGHDAGDVVLKAMGGILSAAIRSPDIVARIGGEEFCVLLVNRSQTEIQATFEKLRVTIQEAVIFHNDQPIPITASIGISTQVTSGLDALLNQADAALYVAKHTGRNRVVFHEPEPV
ncbi:MAG: diguanylate cyclase [Magnetococcus sp. MYC-9]